MKLHEVPKETKAQTYPHADPVTILAHQLPDPIPPAVQMLTHAANLMHELFCLSPAEIDGILDKLTGEYIGPLGALREIALMLKNEQHRAAHFTRPAYYYADERGER